MSQTIWKFPLDLVDRQVVEIPSGAEVLTVQYQNEQPCLWAIVTPENEKEPRVFEIHGTGNLMASSPERRYISTVQRGPFVWHIFERLG